MAAEEEHVPTPERELATAPSGPREMQFIFTGNGFEFFKIWIVNLILTILTLGIYSAWAKVRTKRYFYGNTILDGISFEYHARPLNILIGRLVVFGTLVGLTALELLDPYMAGLAGLAIFFGAPFLITWSLRFNARMSSYRNVRFNFTGDYGEAAAAYLLWPMAAFASLGTLLPLARRATSTYYINYHTYGGRPFQTALSGGALYWIYFQALLFLLAAFTAIGFGAKNLAADFSLPQILPSISFLVPLIFLPVIAAGVYVDTRVVNLATGKTQFDRRHSFRSHMSAFKMIGIHLTNLLLTLLTLGLYYPWARVRVYRYRASRTIFIAESDLSEFVSQALARQNAVAEEFTDLWDWDVGV
jgi:uncharacterized membrane protein YjgN (DUF898 family)